MDDNKGIAPYRWIGIIIGILLTDFYLFPLRFSFFPFGNTKIYMSIVAIGLVLFHGKKHITAKGSRVFTVLCCYALGVSSISVFSVVINNTTDYTYATYIISMLVWLGGAFTLVYYLNVLHDGLTINILIFYLLTVSALQCISAVLINNSPQFENLICSVVADQKSMLEFAKERLCGIACSFDPAGIRFSAVLIISSFTLPGFLGDKNTCFLQKLLYINAILIIIVVGSMISRTTSVGAIMGFAYIVYAITIGKSLNSNEKYAVLKWLIIGLTITLPVVFYLYNVNENVREQLRFGFEGFFSVAESGKWDVHSNNILMEMVVFPDKIKTWCIGDGFFMNPSDEAYYIGKNFKGYYMDTDIGYLRFIFYCGLIGLVSFILYFLYVAKVCISFFPRLQSMILALLCLQFIVWLKVSTDIFSIFAIFISWGSLEMRAYYYSN